MNAAADLQKLDGEILPPQLAVRAMRDSGYRNTAYALAELIDNSIQSGAKDVAVICLQTRQLVKERETRRIEPPRVCRRPFRLSHAAMAGSSMSA